MLGLPKSLFKESKIFIQGESDKYLSVNSIKLLTLKYLSLVNCMWKLFLKLCSTSDNSQWVKLSEGS